MKAGEEIEIDQRCSTSIGMSMNKYLLTEREKEYMVRLFLPRVSNKRRLDRRQILQKTKEIESQTDACLLCVSMSDQENAAF